LRHRPADGVQLLDHDVLVHYLMQFEHTTRGTTGSTQGHLAGYPRGTPRQLRGVHVSAYTSAAPWMRLCPCTHVYLCASVRVRIHAFMCTCMQAQGYMHTFGFCVPACSLAMSMRPACVGCCHTHA
jgi:hypothetical protein